MKVCIHFFKRDYVCFCYRNHLAVWDHFGVNSKLKMFWMPGQKNLDYILCDGLLQAAVSQEQDPLASLLVPSQLSLKFSRGKRGWVCLLLFCFYIENVVPQGSSFTVEMVICQIPYLGQVYLLPSFLLNLKAICFSLSSWLRF